MEDKSLIQYKWQHGIYQLKDMIKMVQNKTINENDFFKITRYDFQSIKTKDLEISKKL